MGKTDNKGAAPLRFAAAECGVKLEKAQMSVVKRTGCRVVGGEGVKVT